MRLPLHELQQVERFRVSQRFAMMVNRYDVYVVDRSGNPAPEPVAFAQQKRMALREQLTLYADDSSSAILCSFRAQQMLDVAATYDVLDAAGESLGSFRKDFGRSLLRSTFHMDQLGAPTATGQESSLAIALIRRVNDSIPLPISFTFSANGAPVMTVSRAFSVRDNYDVSIAAPWLDRRLALAMCVGLDALMSR